MRLRNTNPCGAIYLALPGVGHVEAGEEFEVTDKIGAELLKQEGNYSEVEDDSTPSKKKRVS